MCSLENTFTRRRPGHPSLMPAWWKRATSKSYGRTILFLGDRTALGEIISAVTARGFGTVEIPHPALICAVADDVVLSGRGSRADTSKLLRVRELDIPCLTPEQALVWLDELRAGGHLASA